MPKGSAAKFSRGRKPRGPDSVLFEVVTLVAMIATCFVIWWIFNIHAEAIFAIFIEPILKMLVERAFARFSSSRPRNKLQMNRPKGTEKVKRAVEVEKDRVI